MDSPDRHPTRDEPLVATGPRRRCVVTGAAGFIGSRLSTRLAEEGWTVVGIDGFTDSYDPLEKRARAAALARLGAVTMITGDLAEMDLEAHFGGAEVIFHLAGRAGVRPSFDIESRYVHDNIAVTEAVVSAARRAGVRRVVYASSSSIYGDSPTPFREEAAPAPISPYGRTKLAAERICLAAAGDALETVALRYFTVYGPGQRPDMGLRIFAEAALSGRPLTLLGDGTQSRDFTYVDDIVSATVAAADRPVSGLAINVGGGSTVTLIEVVDLLSRLVGRTLDVEIHPFARGDVRATEADTTRAARLLGFRARVPFEAGLSAQVTWVRERLESIETQEARSA